MELQFVRNVRYDPVKAEETRLEAVRSDVALSVHAPYYVNLSSPSPETRRKSEEWVLKALQGAHDFGAWIVVVHAASYGSIGSEGTTLNVISSLRRIRREAEGKGLDALIGLETMGKRGSWGTVSEILSVMKEVEGVCPVLDFAHMQARGPALSPESLDGALSLLRDVPRLHCHLSGIEYGDAGEKRHLRLGQGLDHEMVLSSLLKDGRPATVICESTAPLEDAAIIRNYLDGSM